MKQSSLKGTGRWSLLAALVAGEACSIYATFFAHALSPASVYVGRPIQASPPPVWAEFDTDRLKVVITLSFALKVQNTEQSTDAVP